MTQTYRVREPLTAPFSRLMQQIFSDVWGWCSAFPTCHHGASLVQFHETKQLLKTCKSQGSLFSYIWNLGDTETTFLGVVPGSVAFNNPTCIFLDGTFFLPSASIYAVPPGWVCAGSTEVDRKSRRHPWPWEFTVHQSLGKGSDVAYSTEWHPPWCRVRRVWVEWKHRTPSGVRWAIIVLAPSPIPDSIFKVH